MPKKELKVAPLSASFMVTSIVGFFISIVFVANYSRTWAFTFGLFFILMFIASLISMTYGPDSAQMYAWEKPQKK